MPAPITKESLLAALTEVVAERGEDFVYVPPESAEGACVYQAGNGQASCIFGAALRKLGVPLKKKWDKNGWSIDKVLDDLGVTDGQLGDDLLEVQVRQDTGDEYGSVLEVAKEVLV